MKRTPLRRSVRIKPSRSKPRRGELSPEEKEAIRRLVYGECGGRCELNLSEKCIRGFLPFEGPTPWDHWHLVHRRNKRMWGWDRRNLAGGCWHCHLVVLHSYGPSLTKPCPPKPKLTGGAYGS